MGKKMRFLFLKQRINVCAVLPTAAVPTLAGQDSPAGLLGEVVVLFPVSGASFPRRQLRGFGPGRNLRHVVVVIRTSAHDLRRRRSAAKREKSAT